MSSFMRKRTGDEKWPKAPPVTTVPVTQFVADQLCALMAKEVSNLHSESMTAIVTHEGKTYKGILFWIEDEKEQEHYV